MGYVFSFVLNWIFHLLHLRTFLHPFFLVSVNSILCICVSAHVSVTERGRGFNIEKCNYTYQLYYTCFSLEPDSKDLVPRELTGRGCNHGKSTANQKSKSKKKKKHEHRKQCKKRKEKNGGRKSQGKCILIAKEKTIVYNKGHSFSHFPSLFVFLIIIIMFVTFQFSFFGINGPACRDSCLLEGS